MARTFLAVDSYISELFKYRVHLKLGCVAVVDTEASGFLIVGLVYFLQRKQRKRDKHNLFNAGYLLSSGL